MTVETPRVLVADRLAASRDTLEPILRRAGWEFVTVDSSFHVLRTVRDADVDVVLINPDLPGSGVSGIDVVKALKSATEFRGVPVLLLLRGDERAPDGVPADGVVALERMTPDEVIATIRTAVDAPTASRTTAAATGNGGGAATELGMDVAETVRTEASRLAEAAVRAYCDKELHRIVETAVRQVVPDVAERMIRGEIEHARKTRGELVQAAEAAARRYAEGELGRVVTEAIRELAREVIPAAVDRVVREEIDRLRAAYGLERRAGEPPMKESSTS